MGCRIYIDKNKENLAKIGGIVSLLNRIENWTNHIISATSINTVYFNDEYLQFVDDVLNDRNIFRSFEEKRLVLIKIIETVDYLIKKNNLEEKFDKEKYLNLCKEINRIQKFRNKIAHTHLGFTQEGLGVAYKKKTNAQLLAEKHERISFKEEHLDLEKMLEECIQLCDNLENCSKEFLPLTIRVFSYNVEKI